jgi:hypothetical protein
MFADPARLDEILFGIPESTSIQRVQTGFEPAASRFRVDHPVARLLEGLGGQAGRPIFEQREVTTPGKPGLVSQFREGLTPALNANLGNLSRAVAAGQSLIASNLGRRRLGGTGIGEGLRSIGDVAPGIAGFNARQAFETDAFSQALNAALQLMGAQAGVGVAGQPQTGQFGDSIAGAGSTIGTYLAQLGLRPTTGGGGSRPLPPPVPGTPFPPIDF